MTRLGEQKEIVMTIDRHGFVAALAVTAALLALGCGDATPPAASPTDVKAPSTTSATVDGDGDGIPDSVDKCPDKKEDGQAPDPKDGCPKS
jgi:hypothetical protein